MSSALREMNEIHGSRADSERKPVLSRAHPNHNCSLFLQAQEQPNTAAHTHKSRTQGAKAA